MTNEELQQLVEHISRAIFQKPFVHKAYFNNRLRTTGGRYHLASHDIDFNPRVMEMHGIEELEQVVKHELCHYHLHLEGRGYRHIDLDFKLLLKQSGGSRFVKDLRNTEITKPKWTYFCGNCGQLYHRKRRIDTQKYVCGKCRGKLQVKG